MRLLKHKVGAHGVILILIILFALSLRLYRLEQIPSGLYADEAIWGYDAYSLLKTSHDTRGAFLPLLVNHHGVANNEAMYAYLTILPVWIFDLNAFSTRFMAALVGSLTIITTYLFTKELLNKRIGLIAAILTVASPWHLQFSRIAFSAILVPFFITLGLYFFIKGLKNTKWLMASALVLGLSLHTYTVTKVSIPLVVIALLLIYLKEFISILKSKKRIYVFIAACIFLIFAGIAYYLFYFAQGNFRFNYISVFATSDQPYKQAALNFLKHLSPNFLFIHGDGNLRHNIPGVGQILLILTPFILFAFLYLIVNKQKNVALPAVLFLIGLIPASLTNEGIPHALRGISAVPFLEIFAALGIFISFKYLKNVIRPIRIILSITIIALLMLNVGYFLHAYFVKYPPISQTAFEYGLEEAIKYSKEQSEKYDKIIFTPSIAQASVLFFTKFDPEQLHKTGMGKYVICSVDINQCYKEASRNLFVVWPNELPGRPVKKNINNPNNQTLLKIIES